MLAPTFPILSVPTQEKLDQQNELVEDARKASEEARNISARLRNPERLRHAAKLYRERLTGIVEDK